MCLVLREGLCSLLQDFDLMDQLKARYIKLDHEQDLQKCEVLNPTKKWWYRNSANANVQAVTCSCLLYKQTLNNLLPVAMWAGSDWLIIPSVWLLSPRPCLAPPGPADSSVHLSDSYASELQNRCGNGRDRVMKQRSLRC